MFLVGRAHSRNSRRPRIQNILDWAWHARIASLKLSQMAPFMLSGWALPFRYAVPDCDLARVRTDSVDVPFRGNLDQRVIMSSR